MFCEAVDNWKEVRVVFCDISKAFDRVWHKGFCSNWPLLVALDLFFVGSRVIYLGVDKELS